MPPASSTKKGSAARGGGRTHGRKGAGHGEEEHENSERWLVTYADLLTVLLALFIVLFAISALNESKFQQLKYSLAAVFGDGSIGVLDGSPDVNESDDNNRVPQPPDRPTTPDVDDFVQAIPDRNGLMPGFENPLKEGLNQATQDSTIGAVIDTGSPELDAAIKAEVESFEEIKREIDLHLDDAGMEGAVSYSVDARGLIVTVVTNALVFPGNSATLLPRGEKLLAAITPALKKVNNNIEVDGFTNQVDVSTYPFPSGWELSSARASAVVRYMEKHGLADRQLAAVGFSDQKPLVDPKDPESVTRNRRVEIVVLSSLPSAAGNAMSDAANTADNAKSAQADAANSSKSTSAESQIEAPPERPVDSQGQAARGAHTDSTQSAAPAGSDN